jgi:alpha-galactosidase
MKKYGLQAAGYNYVNIDDCWSLKNRSKSGELVAGRILLLMVDQGYN